MSLSYDGPRDNFDETMAEVEERDRLLDEAAAAYLDDSSWLFERACDALDEAGIEWEIEDVRYRAIRMQREER